MAEKINEECLYFLKKDKKNEVNTGFINIRNPFLETINKLSKLCDNPNSRLKDLVQFISTNIELKKLNGHYRYCKNLRGSYQAFHANNDVVIKDIKDTEKIFLENKKDNPEYDIQERITLKRIAIKEKYILWAKAYSIKKTYALCHQDKSILTFSHRIDGWSDPSYQLTPNFSLELKTNFGYSYVSYFYNKLKYKNIEITPFSDWVKYETAHFSEIIRYTRRYPLTNAAWIDALDFTKEACNLSMKNEKKFIEEYVIEECERMVEGLEDILQQENFEFKTWERGGTIRTNKKGHLLIEFRGEKMSGALDFISKIIEFEGITSIKSFVRRIEDCNIKIQPILIEEEKLIQTKVARLESEKMELKPKYELVIEKYKGYNEKKYNLTKQMVSEKQLTYINMDVVKRDKKFNTIYPDYEKFLEEYKKVTGHYQFLNQQILNHTKIRENIIKYEERICEYLAK